MNSLRRRSLRRRPYIPKRQFFLKFFHIHYGVKFNYLKNCFYRNTHAAFYLWFLRGVVSCGYCFYKTGFSKKYVKVFNFDVIGCQLNLSSEKYYCLIDMRFYDWKISTNHTHSPFPAPTPTKSEFRRLGQAFVFFKLKLRKLPKYCVKH